VTSERSKAARGSRFIGVPEKGIVEE